uniref:RING-type domain-containing protein n=1 Tax=Gopherus evgoodei TaxID=1825980 RepID=A0A8C5F336_9SAUR
PSGGGQQEARGPGCTWDGKRVNQWGLPLSLGSFPVPCCSVAELLQGLLCALDCPNLPPPLRHPAKRWPRLCAPLGFSPILSCPHSKAEEEEGDSTLTMELLKAQIQELRRQLLQKDSYKCHICLDSYSVPLTSIQCWHIHCEQCWLRTLGSKKLCPQCNAITSPSDLRRVYL